MRSSASWVPRKPDPLNPADRREFSRSWQSYRVCIRSEEGDKEVVASGSLINVSLGGGFVCVNRYLSRDQPCSLEIFGAEGRVVPTRMAGRVISTSVGPGNDFLLRIEFLEPIKIIKEPGKM